MKLLSKDVPYGFVFHWDRDIPEANRSTWIYIGRTGGVPKFEREDDPELLACWSPRLEERAQMAWEELCNSQRGSASAGLRIVEAAKGTCGEERGAPGVAEPESPAQSYRANRAPHTEGQQS